MTWSLFLGLMLVFIPTPTHAQEAARVGTQEPETRSARKLASYGAQQNESTRRVVLSFTPFVELESAGVAASGAFEVQIGRWVRPWIRLSRIEFADGCDDFGSSCDASAWQGMVGADLIILGVPYTGEGVYLSAGAWGFPPDFVDGRWTLRAGLRMGRARIRPMLEGGIMGYAGGYASAVVGAGLTIVLARSGAAAEAGS